ncbi:hypothetical protein BDY24DRAFT_383814 [Mrakia frigida]|uniref:uncharacterized protein n=1 Tax=Mrakia frigida TaxID=29902 RepID=UPI003FCC267A
MREGGDEAVELDKSRGMSDKGALIQKLGALGSCGEKRWDRPQLRYVNSCREKKATNGQEARGRRTRQ